MEVGVEKEEKEKEEGEEGEEGEQDEVMMLMVAANVVGVMMVENDRDEGNLQQRKMKWMRTRKKKKLEMM